MNDNAQRAHYVEIHDAYNAHYFDKTSNAYRARFIYDRLFTQDLNHREVAELASGSGANSLALLERYPFARVTGFDISPSACTEYRQHVGRPAVEVDLTQPWTGPKDHFDAAFVIGGLHHCVSDLNMALHNISLMLKPGGSLLMFEPNANFMLERVRKLWYQRDRFFDADTEAALDPDMILTSAFKADWVQYFGGPAYFFILNSLVMRVPLGWKGFLAPPLTVLERCYEMLPGKAPYPAFLARWRKV